MNTLVKVKSTVQNYLSHLTVEPIIFFNFLSLSIYSVSQHAIIYKAVCVQYFQEENPYVTCDNLQDDPVLEDKVQKSASSWAMLLSLCYMIPAVPSDIFLGAWSDRHGRKVSILLGFAGMVFSAYPLILVSSRPADVPVYVLAFSNTIAGLTGYIAIITISCLSYLADLVQDKDTLIYRMTLVSVSRSVSEVLGSFLLGRLLKFLKPSSAVLVAQVVLAVGFFYTLARIEQLTPEQMRKKYYKSREVKRSVGSIQFSKSSGSTGVKRDTADGDTSKDHETKGEKSVTEACTVYGSIAGPFQEPGGPFPDATVPPDPDLGPSREPGGPPASTSGPFHEPDMTHSPTGGPFQETGGPFQETGGPFQETGGPFQETGGPFQETGGPFQESSSSAGNTAGPFQEKSGSPVVSARLFTEPDAQSKPGPFQAAGRQPKLPVGSFQNTSAVTTRTPGPFHELVQVSKYICQLYKEVWRTLVKPRQFHKRTYMALTIFIFFCYMMAELGLYMGPILSLYVFHRPFYWTASTLGTFKGVQHTCALGANILGACVMKKYLKGRESWVVLFALASCVLHLALTGVASCSWMLYLAAGLGCFNTLSVASLKSFLARQVESDEVGKALAANGIATDLAYVCTMLIFNNVYRATVSFYSGFAFLLGALVLLLCFFIALWMTVDLRKQKMKSIRRKEEGKKEDITMKEVEMKGA